MGLRTALIADRQCGMGEPPLGIVYVDRGYRYSRSQGAKEIGTTYVIKEAPSPACISCSAKELCFCST